MNLADNLTRTAEQSPDTIANRLDDATLSYAREISYPRHVHPVDALPKGSTGKILKREIHLPVPAAAVSS